MIGPGPRHGEVEAEDGASGYAAFLHAKAAIAVPTGIEIEPSAISPVLKPHQRDAVRWAVRGGRRALFESFGLGKTLQQLEILRLILEQTTGRGLIVCPLGVRQEFARDALLLGLAPRFIRRTAEAVTDGIYITNYESVRDGKVNAAVFDAVSLDEAAILRGFGGTKTFREMMRLFEGTATFRFVATATPSPNDYIELLAYAGFLDILDVGQAKTRFFQRDSEKADNLTLLPHAEHEFWMWVASWALFMQRPSDLGYPDDGYELPPIEVVWHEVPASGTVTPADFDRDGRAGLFRDASMGVRVAAAEKRSSIPSRVARTREILDESPDDHFLIWHDREAERHQIAAAVPDAVSVWGSQDLDEREKAIIDFSDGQIKYLSTKPVIAGSGCNFQRHCHRAIFTGIGFKFAEFIQAVHRIQRFQQSQPVRIDLIYTEAEREIRKLLERKWRNHVRLVDRMAAIIAEHGLAHGAIDGALKRSIGVERREHADDGYRLILNDSVVETREMDSDSVGLIVTSIPFSTQYEYSPSYNDFGHNADNEAFWAQMDHLTPELVRVLAPGRNAAIHVKDRIVPGGINGLGFRTLHPFHAEAITHYMRHGLAFLGMITVVTDVVRENNGNYRLSWSEQCKDGSPMGVGVPEYVLIFRRAPTDRSDGYADVPVVKDKAAYTLGRWQVDAHGFWRSNGNRLLGPDDLAGLTHAQMFRLFRDHHLANGYDVDSHVRLADHLREAGRLPVDFMLFQPPSTHPDVWTDVARMRTLNMIQAQKGKEQHLCPLQFDIVDRLIGRYSNPDDLVFDPFAGLMTVPYCALKLGRQAVGIELNPGYWADGVQHVETIAREQAMPTLFDLFETLEATTPTSAPRPPQALDGHHTARSTPSQTPAVQTPK